MVLLQSLPSQTTDGDGVDSEAELEPRSIHYYLEVLLSFAHDNGPQAWIEKMSPTNKRSGVHDVGRSMMSLLVLEVDEAMMCDLTQTPLHKRGRLPNP